MTFSPHKKRKVDLEAEGDGEGGRGILEISSPPISNIMSGSHNELNNVSPNSSISTPYYSSNSQLNSPVPIRPKFVVPTAVTNDSDSEVSDSEEEDEIAKLLVNVAKPKVNAKNGATGTLKSSILTLKETGREDRSILNLKLPSGFNTNYNKLIDDSDYLEDNMLKEETRRKERHVQRQELIRSVKAQIGANASMNEKYLNYLVSRIEKGNDLSEFYFFSSRGLHVPSVKPNYYMFTLDPDNYGSQSRKMPFDKLIETILRQSDAIELETSVCLLGQSKNTYNVEVEKLYGLIDQFGGNKEYVKTGKFELSLNNFDPCDFELISMRLNCFLIFMINHLRWNDEILQISLKLLFASVMDKNMIQSNGLWRLFGLFDRIIDRIDRPEAEIVSLIMKIINSLTGDKKYQYRIINFLNLSVKVGMTKRVSDIINNIAMSWLLDESNSELDRGSRIRIFIDTMEQLPIMSFSRSELQIVKFKFMVLQSVVDRKMQSENDSRELIERINQFKLKFASYVNSNDNGDINGEILNLVSLVELRFEHELRLDEGVIF